MIATAPRRFAALIALTALIGLTAGVVGQGPVYRERWSDLHLELLREQVLIASQGRDQATLQTVADLVATSDGGAPFRPAARALAHLRGVAADDAFLLRASMGAFVLPEVVDPASDREDCRSLNVSMQLPYVMPIPGAIDFDLEVLDRAGARLHRATFGAGATLEDLRMAYTRIAVPGNELADGSYRLRITTRLDGAAGRDTDPVLEHTFHVLRGYGARAAGVAADGSVALGRLGPAPRAVFAGMLLEVQRAFAGEAFDGSSDAVADLERAERAFDNVEAGREPLDGLTGPVPLGLPTGGEAVLGAVVNLPAGRTKRPLVVVVGSAPAFDVEGRRPLGPVVRSARWVQRRVGDLGLGTSVHMAWLQSPGGGMPFAKSLPTALAALRELVPTDGRTVLVLELEAAVAMCYAPEVLASEATAVVLVGAGAMALPQLRKLGEIPILGVQLTGHRSSQGLQFTGQLARGEHGTIDWPCHFERAPAAPRPWTFGAMAARSEIAAFVRAQTAPK